MDSIPPGVEPDPLVSHVGVLAQASPGAARSHAPFCMPRNEVITFLLV